MYIYSYIYICICIYPTIGFSMLVWIVSSKSALLQAIVPQRPSSHPQSQIVPSVVQRVKGRGLRHNWQIRRLGYMRHDFFFSLCRRTRIYDLHLWLVDASSSQYASSTDRTSFQHGVAVLTHALVSARQESDDGRFRQAYHTLGLVPAGFEGWCWRQL